MAAPGRARRDAAPIRITTAPTSHREDLDRRRRRYAISMGIRTLCFIGAVTVGEGWLRWVLIAGAFILPYIAVVMANSASPQIEGADMDPLDHGYKELGTGEDGPTVSGPTESGPDEHGPSEHGPAERGPDEHDSGEHRP